MDIKQIISQMSLEQKVLILSGSSMANTNAIESLGIESIYMTDGSNGVRMWDNSMSVCFPAVVAQCSTWNTELSAQVGYMLSCECYTKNVDILLAPGINIKRNPLCGRNFEYYSEDTFLTTEMASAFVAAVQNNGIGVSIKHFAANNQEVGARGGISSNVSERALREIYLNAFESIVKFHRPYLVMCAYNRLNGTYCSEHIWLLEQVLRLEWGFEGVIVSDWGAVHDKIASLKATLDLEMPVPADNCLQTIIEAIDNRDYSIEQLDLRVIKILELIKRVKDNKKPQKIVSLSEKIEVARKVNDESITLLKNDDKILPINIERKQKILIVGELAMKPAVQGGGCAHVNCANIESPLDYIRKLAGENITIDYTQGYDSSKLEYDGYMGLDVAAKARQADLVVVFVGNSASLEREVFDRSDMSLPNNMCQVIDDVLHANSNVVIVVQAGAIIDMRLFARRAKAIVYQWFGGEYGGKSIAKVLFGLINPSGKTTETFLHKLSDCPASKSYLEDDNYVSYDEDILVGYKYYDSMQIPVLFPFGHGLSYTSYEYSNITCERQGRNCIIGCDITNTGDMDGKEVVQVYVHSHNSQVIISSNSLCGFAKISLESGETNRINITIAEKSLMFYCTISHSWQYASTSYTFNVGSSSRDIRQSIMFERM